MMAFRVERDLSKNLPPLDADRRGRSGVCADSLSDDEFQAAMLQGVSRTFALTIPQLPPALSRVVSNAYLLCRIVDTIEDEPALTGRQKDRFYRQFLGALSEEQKAQRFSEQLYPLLSSATIAAEHELIHNLPRVVRITRGFSVRQRRAMERCVRIMAQGMREFQHRGELQTLEDLDRYCYYVAGVVGQMLTSLFCLHSAEIANRHDALMRLAVSFGQGLQMTNILKDVWEDNRRGACWLPREIFAKEGLDLRELNGPRNRDGFERGIYRLIGVAHRHLRNALAYTLLIPKQEAGVRTFCLWAIGFAVLTLRKINNHADYTDGAQVKISRLSVKGTMLATRLARYYDEVLNVLFSVAARRLPLASPFTDGSHRRASNDRSETGT